MTRVLYFVRLSLLYSRLFYTYAYPYKQSMALMQVNNSDELRYQMVKHVWVPNFEKSFIVGKILYRSFIRIHYLL